jgi:DNA-binding MarR family transcriptional regulator
MNYLLGQLEARDYIERRAERGSSRRLVFLTNRGWQVRETIFAVTALRRSGLRFSVSDVSTNA